MRLLLISALFMALMLAACGKNVQVEGGASGRDAGGAVLIGVGF